MEIFIGYILATGEIKSTGKVDRNKTPDGSTIYERIQEILISNPKISVLY